MLHLQQEIAEQPDVLARLLREGTPVAARVASAIQQFDPAFVMIAARGTSDNAGRYAQYLLGTLAGLPVALAAPSIHTLYEAAPRLRRALVIGISQSGQSNDVRRVLTDARQQGALTLSITNDDKSPLAVEAEYHMPIYAGPEISVAATKTYTAELLAVALLVTALTASTEQQATLTQLPGWAAETLRLAEPSAGWAERYRYMERFAVIGRGYNYATAFEIGLKIKELCYVSGVEYSEADFRHGPIALVEPGLPVFMVMPKGKTLAIQRDLLAKLNERHAECLLISNAEIEPGTAHKVMAIPADVPEWLSPIVAVIPGQVFAMNLAIAKGHTVDAPTGLNKVTVTI